MELREYRKRVSLTGATARSPSLNGGLPPYLAGKGLGNATLNNPNDVNFQFEFPKFGYRLPNSMANGTNGTSGTRQSSTPSTITQTPSPIDRNEASPLGQTLGQLPSSSGPNVSLNQEPVIADSGDMSSLSGLFSPSLLESVSKSPSFEYFGNDSSNGSRSSTDSNRQMSTGHNTSYSSPSASSNNGLSSSCGTSPEPSCPSLQSPATFGKGTDATLTTIGEEQSNDLSGKGELTFCDKLNMACGNPNNPIPRTMTESGVTSGNLDVANFDVNGIDWLAQQNGNQFDPQLFGDYREPQENILSSENFSDSFFTDAYALPDFNSPFNVAPSPAPVKKDLVAQIDEKLEDEEVVPGDDGQMLNCNTIWYDSSRPLKSYANINARDRLQACPKVKEGEFDLDLLCKDLQKKAKCSETGAVVNESDFNKIMKSYVENGGQVKNA
jgi:AP-1-like factor